MVEMVQRNYVNSKLIQIWPFANYVMKPSYPIYLRIAGVFLWVSAGALDYLLLTGWLY